jgi:hypothetical protein
MREVDGATDHDALAERSELLLGLRAEVGEEEGEEIDDGVRAREDAGRLEAAIGDVGLERLDEAALALGLEVAIDGAWPGDGLVATARVPSIGMEVEDGAKGVGGAALVAEARQRDAIAVRDADGAVGGAEVEADGASRGVSQRVAFLSVGRFLMGRFLVASR